MKRAVFLLTALLASSVLSAGLSETDLPSLEKAIHAQVNCERAKAGLGALAWDSPIAEVARKHSRDMAARHFFSHQDPAGREATERAKEDGLILGRDFQMIGENILSISRIRSVRTTIDDEGEHVEVHRRTPEDIAKETVEGWMASTGHRENLLRREFNREGIGVAVDSKGEVLVTQVLISRGEISRSTDD